MDEKTIKCMMSSIETVYETPNSFYQELDFIFNFDLDVCAIEANSKAPAFISPEQDGLITPWQGVCWMNPPYGREIKHWVERAHDQTNIIKSAETVVCLLPARTDTRWFQTLWNFAPVLCFISGRLKFGTMTSCAPFPSVVAVLGKIKKEQIVGMEFIGNVRTKK